MPSAAAVATRSSHHPSAGQAHRPTAGRRTGSVAALRLARSGSGNGVGSAGRGDHEPLGAEGVDALAVELSGPAVALVVVQRVAVVGDLGGAVTAANRAQQRRLDAATRLGGPAALIDRPGSDTGAGARRLVRL